MSYDRYGRSTDVDAPLRADPRRFSLGDHVNAPVGTHPGGVQPRADLLMMPPSLARQREIAASSMGVPAGVAGAGAPPRSRVLQNLPALNRGNSYVLSLPTAATVVRAPVAELRSQSDEAELLIITLGISTSGLVDSPGASVTSYASNHSAHITWGAAGALQSVDLDWMHGTQIAVAANYVRIEVDPSPSTAAALAGTSVTFSASFSYGGGAPPSRNRAQKTIVLADLNTGATSTEYVAIPNFAVGVAPVGASGVAAATPLYVTLLDGNGVSSVVTGVWRYEGGPIPTDGYPIPGGSLYAQFSNFSGATITKPRLLFALAF